MKNQQSAYIFHNNIEGSRPGSCISSMIYSRDTPFWLETIPVKKRTKCHLFLAVLNCTVEHLSVVGNTSKHCSAVQSITTFPTFPTLGSHCIGEVFAYISICGLSIILYIPFQFQFHYSLRHSACWVCFCSTFLTLGGHHIGEIFAYM